MMTMLLPPFCVLPRQHELHIGKNAIERELEEQYIEGIRLERRLNEYGFLLRNKERIVNFSILDLLL